MKVIPVAINHMLLELEDGSLLDINDETLNGQLHIKLEEKYKILLNRAGKKVYLITSTTDPFSLSMKVQILDKMNKGD